MRLCERQGQHEPQSVPPQQHSPSSSLAASTSKGRGTGINQGVWHRDQSWHRDQLRGVTMINQGGGGMRMNELKEELTPGGEELSPLGCLGSFAQCLSL